MMTTGTQPKVSVIIPVYNGERFLLECVESVIHQTLKEIEIIIVDDGSTDKTPSIIRSLQKKDSRIRSLRLEHNNAGNARNAGMKIAKGDFLSFLDADDVFAPEMLEKCAAAMERESSDVLVYAASEFDMRTGTIKPMPWSLRIDQCPDHSPFHPTEMAELLLNSFQNWPWNKMFRRSFIVEHHIVWQSVIRTNDLAFTTQALTQAERISVLNESFVNYRIGSGTSLQQTNHASPLAFWDAFKETKRRMQEDGTFQTYEKSYLRSAMNGMIYNYESIKDSQAKRTLYDYIREHAEADFGFSRFPRTFYLESDKYDKYIKIIRHIDSPVKVSVVLPSLNVAPFIRECIESAINQTMRDIEIICVDAGSTDGTLEILEEYAQKDSRIKILHSPVKSYGYQMNMGMDAATGQYFAILETDDYIKPLMYEELYQLAEDNLLDIIKPDYSLFVTDEENWKYFNYIAMVTNRALGQYNQVYTPADNFGIFDFKNVIWTGLYDLAFLRSNNIRFHESPGASYQDNGFWFLTMCQAKRLMYFERDYYMLRRDNPDSSVHSKGKVFCMCDEYAYIREELRKKPELEEKFAPLLARYRFRNYEWNYERIGDEFKDLFLERFAKDFRELMEQGEIHGEYFNMEESIRLRMILENPDAYKFHRLSVENREYIKTWTPDLGQRRQSDLEKTQYDLDCVHQSHSFRIGRAITWLPRALRDGARRLPKGGETAEEQTGEVERDYNFYNNLHRDFYLTELQRWYLERTGKPLSLRYPSTFNEKIQWLKLYNTTPQKGQLSDLCRVREYAAERIGEEYLVLRLGEWKKFGEIDFTKLPDSFVLRVNHGCEDRIPVASQAAMDRKQVGDRITDWLGHNYAFDNGFELQYMNLSPRIFAEPYAEVCPRKRYGVFCFAGHAEYILHEDAFFDRDGNRLDLAYADARSGGEAPTADLGTLAALAEKLAEGLCFVRVDFRVEDDGTVKFEKLCFTPESGVRPWMDEEMDRALGEKLILPIKYPVPKYEGYDRMKKDIIARGR